MKEKEINDFCNKLSNTLRLELFKKITNTNYSDTQKKLILIDITSRIISSTCISLAEEKAKILANMIAEKVNIYLNDFKNGNIKIVEMN